MRLNSVQYLRAFAALLVVLYHAAGHAANNMNLRPDFAFLDLGQYGVDLFFVTSGFIMVVTTVDKPSASEFMRKRLIRIVPLYWTVTLVYVLTEFAAPGLLRSSSRDAVHILFSFLFVPAYHPRFVDHIWPVVIPGWSLNYEMFFYTLFGLALVLSARYRSLLMVGAMMSLLAVPQFVQLESPIWMTYTSTLLLEFAFGIVVGEVFLMSKASITGAVACLFVPIAAAALIYRLDGGAVCRALLYGSISASLLSFVLYLEQSGARFSNKLVLSIGDASYSIYLLHFMIVASLRSMRVQLGLNSTELVVDLMVVAAALALAIVVGLLSFALFERPVTAWLKSAFVRNGSLPVVPAAEHSLSNFGMRKK